MSKKNKKKKAIEYFDVADHLADLRDSLDDEYNDLLDQIAYHQYLIYKTDKKARKKKNKKLKKGKSGFLMDNKRLKVRKKIIKKASKHGGLFDRLIEALKELKPMIQAFATAVARFICMLLNLNSVKQSISPAMLDKIDLVYRICTNI